VTSHFTVQSTIDKDPAKMQAFVTAIWRATQWIKVHTPDQIYDAIEPYVGSYVARGQLFLKSRRCRSRRTTMPLSTRRTSRARKKVWFREMTGIKPLTIADVVSPTFVEVARKAYPA